MDGGVAGKRAAVTVISDFVSFISVRILNATLGTFPQVPNLELGGIEMDGEVAKNHFAVTLSPDCHSFCTILKESLGVPPQIPNLEVGHMEMDGEVAEKSAETHSHFRLSSVPYRFSKDTWCILAGPECRTGPQ